MLESPQVIWVETFQETYQETIYDRSDFRHMVASYLGDEAARVFDQLCPKKTKQPESDEGVLHDEINNMRLAAEEAQVNVNRLKVMLAVNRMNRNLMLREVQHLDRKLKEITD